jgi:hypothetical protein
MALIAKPGSISGLGVGTAHTGADMALTTSAKPKVFRATAPPTEMHSFKLCRMFFESLLLGVGQAICEAGALDAPRSFNI